MAAPVADRPNFKLGLAARFPHSRVRPAVFFLSLGFFGMSPVKHVFAPAGNANGVRPNPHWSLIVPQWNRVVLPLPPCCCLDLITFKTRFAAAENLVGLICNPPPDCLKQIRFEHTMVSALTETPIERGLPACHTPHAMN